MLPLMPFPTTLPSSDVIRLFWKIVIPPPLYRSVTGFWALINRLFARIESERLSAPK